MLTTRPTDGTASGRKRELGFGHSATSVLVPSDPAHVEAIRKSHERCAALGLTRIGHGDYTPLPRADLALAHERNRRLFVHAAPVMELLLEQILVSKSMVVLADTQGTVLHSVGHSDLMERTAKVALAPGVNWSESSKGTNGMGTALVTEEPVFVHADEHFMYANDFLTCSAAPIFDPRGNLLGVLDVTGDHRTFHAHTLGLVKMSARMIENHWLTDDCRHALRLHFHSRVEFIDTLMGGILAVGEDGRLMGANRSALDLLGLSPAGLRMNSLESLFGMDLARLLGQARSASTGPLALTLANGLQLHARLQMNWPLVRPAMELGGPEAPVAEVREVTEVAAEPAPPAPQARERARAAPEAEAAPDLSWLQTGDAQVETVVAKLRRVIDRDIAVLILGETGTGKEVLARAIHQESSRARQPFVAVNCASIPESLIEAELFGYEEGAFTGARRRGAVGRILQAHGGTLFLDEVGDMPLALQARLLRVLQEREVTPLGGTRALAADVAVIAATHCNLRDMIEQQTFREDLYYRLNGLSVRVPPLRERSDLMALAHKILRSRCPLRTPALDAEVVQLLQGYHWPGNVRQLVNVLRAAAAMAGDDPAITRAHLPDDFIEDLQRAAQRRAAPPGSPGAANDAARTPAPQPDAAKSTATLEELEMQTILRVVQELDGNISLASKRLGISRNTIYRKLRRR
ncbi:sigma-54-dependent Fis family transcriptional regulator [Azohydromonas caseinilytica]|uniref:Sigma-54-dependent Fis family transcriptional regulator n=1 Tax=Azohydromonas caseinilytica TaxID=2728836 RepID=A0A848F988_9BURK|nr:sigma-54-dependent Fis family transcriptional regulator [Azohydromonas caseinilytica]NML15818.1 sigma-54-dependent Fis family transcriptional regulator [Azohydromonas caseinilytica]